MNKREIKFRAWHKTEKLMCEIETITKKGCFLIGVKKGEDKDYGDRITVYAPEHGRFCNNDEIEMMQFTGIKDKNGKNMYEGDVIHTAGQDNFYLQVVEFHNTEQTCGRGWIGRNIWLSDRFKNTIKSIDEFSYFSIPHGEIIGNVFENPELLTAKTEEDEI